MRAVWHCDVCDRDAPLRHRCRGKTAHLPHAVAPGARTSHLPRRLQEEVDREIDYEHDWYDDEDLDYAFAFAEFW